MDSPLAGDIKVKVGRLFFLTFTLFNIFLHATSAHATLFEGELSTPSSIHSLLSKEHQFSLEIGLEVLHQDLPTIRNVVTENSRTSTAIASGGKKTGDVASNYPDTFAQTLKIQALIDAPSHWTVALKTYLPLEGIAQMDTGNVYQPEFALYRAEGQRPRILLTSGRDLNSDWRVGLGLDVGFSVNAQANVFLQSGTNTVSDERISAKMKPSFVPQASLAYQNYSLTVRGENKAEMVLSTTAGARVFSGVSAGVDFSFVTQSALFYQPWQFELNAQHAITQSLSLKSGLSYELWTGYQARAAIIQSNVPVNCPSGAGNCEAQFSSGQSPAFKTRNLWIPEVVLSQAWGDDAIEVGYRFKDSIFQGLPTGNGNYLDPPRHDLILGYTHPTQKGWKWNIQAQVSRLASQTVVKSDSSDIGGPSYSVSGWLYGGGFHVAIPF